MPRPLESCVSRRGGGRRARPKHSPASRVAPSTAASTGPAMTNGARAASCASGAKAGVQHHRAVCVLELGAVADVEIALRPEAFDDEDVVHVELDMDVVDLGDGLLDDGLAIDQIDGGDEVLARGVADEQAVARRDDEVTRR